jgi:hypothetical protein
LAEILPIESADMFYTSLNSDYPWIWIDKHLMEVEDIPCWSLAALYSILTNNKRESTTLSRGGWKIDTIEYMPNTWWCEYEDTENPAEYFNTSADNPVDACVDMIIKLHERKML